MSLILGVRLLNAFFHQFGCLLKLVLLYQNRTLLLVSEGGGWETGEELVCILGVGFTAQLRLVQRHHGDGVLLHIRQGGADARLAKRCIEGGKSRYLQLLGIVGIDGRNLTVAMHDSDYLTVFVDERTAHGIIGHGDGEDVVIVGGLELLYA